MEEKIVQEKELAKKLAKGEVKAQKVDKTKRSITVLGVGDGGSKIASDIKNGIDVESISFNTSSRNTDLFNMDVTITIENHDGSGKDRKAARETLTDGILNKLIDKVNNIKSDVVLVTQTTGGGTGCGTGPKITATLADNLYSEKVPVIAIGVYPKLDDSVSIYNTIEWQKDIEKAEVPYMVFNNNAWNGSVINTHFMVNKGIMKTVKVISGDVFKSSDISSMDSEDLLKVISTPGRMTIMYTPVLPPLGMCLGEYIIDMVEESLQEEPDHPKCMALMVKGPKRLIEGMDISLALLKAKYGEPIIGFIHIEEDEEESNIAFITSGNGAPVKALGLLKRKYEEVEFNIKNQKNETEDFSVVNPMAPKRREKKSDSL